MPHLLHLFREPTMGMNLTRAPIQQPLVWDRLGLTVRSFIPMLTPVWREGGMKDFLLGGSWGRLIGFWSVCCQACFAYTGAETIAITAGEVERPRQTVPKAVRRVINRLNLYYVGAVLVLGLNLSSNDPILQWSLNNANVSYHGPFVLMAQRAGIPSFGDFLNVMALGAAFSVANASLYVTVTMSGINVC
jgi:amino acid permease